MTISLITLGVIGAVAIIALLGLAHWAHTSAEKARTNGYDKGYGDAAWALSRDTARLEEQLARTGARLAQANREHDAMLQDADRRIAIYAGRSYTPDDLATLRRAVKQLKAAAMTFAKFPNQALIEQAQFAMTVAEQIEAMASRIEQQFDGNAPAALPTSHPEADATLLEVAAAATSLTNGKSWLVHGPEGCGKTRNAQAIADALGLTQIVDNWLPGQPVPLTKALVLTNQDGPHHPFTRRTLTFDQGMSLVAAKAKQEAAA
jgi:hypothetical protein